MSDKIYPALPGGNEKPAVEGVVHTAAPHPPQRPVQRQGLAGLLPALGGGGIPVLPLVVAVGAMQRGRGGILPQRNRPAAKTMPAALPAPVPQPAATPANPGQQHRQHTQPAAPPVPVAEAVAQPMEQRLPRPMRPTTPPVDVRSLLNDISGYLPASTGTSAARAARLMGLADEIRSLGQQNTMTMASAFTNPIDRHVGILNALGRNVPGAANLGQMSQVLGVVNTLRNAGGGLGALSSLGNLGNMLGSMNAMSSPPPPRPLELKRPPSQGDGLKDTVTRLLNGMDDKQKATLMDQARNFLGK